MTPMVDGAYIDPNQVGGDELTEEQQLYKENILDHYRKPRNKRIVDNPDASAKEKNPLCGDEIEATIALDGETLADVAFQGNGCAISQASMSMLTKKLKGKTKKEVASLGQEFVLDMLGIPIGIVRRKCAMLGLRTVQKALEKRT